MCKGDGGRVLSNVELILPWNVVEACYTLERNDSTCFFAANDAEGTTSQISLSKLEDNSVKIQVTVTALEPDDDDAEPGSSKDGAYKDQPGYDEPGPGESPRHRSPIKGGQGRTQPRLNRPAAYQDPRAQTAPPDRKRPNYDFEDEHEQTPQRPQLRTNLEEEFEEEMSPESRKKFKPRPRHISQLKPTQMNKRLTAMWRTKKKNRARQRMLQALQRRREEARAAAEPQEGGTRPTPSRKQYPLRGGRAGGDTPTQDDPSMPVLEAVENEQGADDEVIDLDLIYRMGPKMRAFEAKRRREKMQEVAKWDQVQTDMYNKRKEGMSMVIVLKGEEEEGGEIVEKQIDDQPILHVIEPIMESGNNQGQYISGNPQSSDGPQFVEVGGKKKFFKSRRDVATRVSKEPSQKNQPPWKEKTPKHQRIKKEKGESGNYITCKLCPKMFRDYSYVYRHTKTYHMENIRGQEYLEELKPFMKVTCEICHKSISSASNIANHMKQCHPTEETQVQCSLCDKWYKTPASLKQHIRQRHTEREKRFPCPECGNKFGERRALQDHINCVHETTQVYTCNKCWKVFLTKSRLRRHLYIHGEFRHICKFCGKGFHIKDNMNKHIRIVHEKNHGKMWKCSYCSKEFLVKGNMTQHIKGIHLKQFPFTCSKCQQGFRRMKDMMLHMEKCSNDDRIGDNLEMFKEEAMRQRVRPNPINMDNVRSMTVPRVRKQDLSQSRHEHEEGELTMGDLVEEGEEYDETMSDIEEDGPHQELILKSNGTDDNHMAFQLEQDGMVIPIEVVIDENDATGSTESGEIMAEVIAEADSQPSITQQA